MSNLAIIPKLDLPPALLSQMQNLNGANDLDAGVSAGFPVMSIRGAKWRIVEGGEEHPVYMPGTKDLAPFVRVILLRANANVSKIYYPGQYVEGSDEPPTCYSNDGIRPAADVEEPQAETCAACPHNVWGSKISPSGAKIKACADSRRVAILPAEDLTYAPILLRVPGASLSDLAKYGRALNQRNIPYAAVVTKLSFDADAAYPKINFQFDGVLTAEQLAQVAERMTDPVIDDILGLTEHTSGPTVKPRDDDKFGIPADIQVPTQAQAADQAEAPAQAPVPKRTRTAKTTKAPASTENAAEAATADEPAADAVVATGSLEADITAALGAIDL